MNDVTDPEWRLENIYKIINKDKKEIWFELNDIQKILRSNKSKRKIILKARQVGISTEEILKISDAAFFEKNVNAVILAHEQDAIEKLFNIPKTAYKLLKENFPTLAPTIDRGGGSKYELFFPKNNSRIYCDLESRGDTIDKLHVSEAAFMKDQKRLLATLESVPISGTVTIESTPNGLNDFYEMWNDPNNGFDKIFFPWFFQQEYQLDPSSIIELTDNETQFVKNVLNKYGLNITKAQLAWRRWKQGSLKKLFIQEYPEDDQSCFLTSSQAVMDLANIRNLLNNCSEPKMDGCFKIYKPPEEGDYYVCGADTAEGVGGDNSSASLFNVRDREQVATIHGNFKPYDFAALLAELCRKYNMATLAVERNNHGHAVLLELNKHLYYENLYWTKDKDGNRKDLGWKTDMVTRPIMIDTFVEGVDNQTIILNDRETLNECLTLINNEGKIEAAQGKHDDAIIASAIGVQICIEENVMGLYNDIENKMRV